MRNVGSISVFFELDNTLDTLKVNIASIHLNNKALLWH